MGFSDLLAVADRAVQDHLGGVVSYKPGWPKGPAVEVKGVFHDSYQRIDLAGIAAQGSGPAVFVRLSDLPSDPNKDEKAAVTARGVEYLVREVQPDGEGGAMLLLRERYD